MLTASPPASSPAAPPASLPSLPCSPGPSPSWPAAGSASPWRMAELEEQAHAQENQQRESKLREQALRAAQTARPA